MTDLNLILARGQLVPDELVISKLLDELAARFGRTQVHADLVPMSDAGGRS